MEHPFAQYIQILGKGKRGARDLTLQEAEQAMTMILSNQVEPVQLGAFLMLMRVKEETPEEIAGFVRAAKQVINVPEPSARVDLDWSSYAGKRRQLPWFILSTLALAGQGVRVFIHGASCHTAARRDMLLFRPVLEADHADPAQALEARRALDGLRGGHL